MAHAGNTKEAWVLLPTSDPVLLSFLSPAGLLFLRHFLTLNVLVLYTFFMVFTFCSSTLSLTLS